MSTRGRGNGSGSGGRNRENTNKDHLRSQSMVPELEKKLTTDTVASQSTASGTTTVTRSKSVTPSPDSLTNFKYMDLNNNYAITCSRPDNGGSLGRKTALETNFYNIQIDYTKGAYHYDAEVIFAYEKRDGKKAEANAKKEYKSAIVEKIFKDNKLGRYVFDGEKNVYTVNALDLSENPNGFQIKMKLDADDDENTYILKLQLAATIDLKTMKDYIEGKVLEIPKSAINLLNLVIRQNKLKTHKLEKNSVFDLNGPKTDLGSGLCYVIGQYLSIKPCLSGWLQNSDMDAAIFYEPIHLPDFLLKIFPKAKLNEQLNELDAKKFGKEIRGLMVQAMHLDSHRKYKVLNIAKLPANQETFELTDGDKTRTITVADYFKEKYNALKYPNLPCIKAGDPKRPISIPLEVCKLVDGQRYRKLLNPQQQKNIAKGTVLLPPARARLINDLMVKNVQDKDYLNEFGIVSCGDNRMTQVNARVLESPKVFYDKNRFAPIRNATWRMANLHLIQASQLNNWLLIWIAKDNRLSQDDIVYYSDVLINGCIHAFGLGNLKTAKPMFKDLRTKTIPEIFNLIRTNCKSKPQLVMFVISQGEERDEIKKIAEKEMGLMTQCINFDKFSSQVDRNTDASNVAEDRKLNMYLSNVLLKVNAKLGGTNNLVDFSLLQGIKLNRPQESVMFFGADVTHNAGEGTSIAAVVGSLDLYFTHYGVQLGEQFHEKENRKSKEIINDLDIMSYNLMSSFRKRNNNMLPTRLVFYRDGVDEGQFAKVLSQELSALKKACNKIQQGYSPLITFIIVVKRHNIRFFPINQNDKMGKSENIPAGIVVDTGITGLNQFDFFLCSHETIQGTAQPTHYYVIHDENNFSSNDIQNLTFMMCHLYVKSTKAVSIPAPVYYAHLAAFRGRMYKQADANSDTQSEAPPSTTTTLSEDEEKIVQSRLIQIHPTLTETMFFT